jgi:hypothetical protein
VDIDISDIALRNHRYAIYLATKQGRSLLSERSDNGIFKYNFFNLKPLPKLPAK